jgi:hypothetical protein
MFLKNQTFSKNWSQSLVEIVQFGQNPDVRFWAGFSSK